MSGDAHGHGGGSGSKLLGIAIAVIAVIIILNNTSCSVNLGGGGARQSFQPLIATDRSTPSAGQRGREAYRALGPVEPGVERSFGVTPPPGCRAISSAQSPDGLYTYTRHICPQ
jgi:hypothetical protein